MTDRRLSDLFLEYKLDFRKKLFDDFYIFESKDLFSARRKTRSAYSNWTNRFLLERLKNEPRVKWFEIQKNLIRIKRSYHLELSNEFEYEEEEDEDEEEDELISYSLGSDQDYTFGRYKYKNVFSKSDQNPSSSSEFSDCKASFIFMNDPEWKNQWYLNEGCSQGTFLNITRVWAMGYTGKKERLQN